MSMIAWMASAVVPEVPHPKAKAVEHSLTGVAHPKAKAVEPTAETDAAPDAPATGDPIISVEPAGEAPGGPGAAPLVPTGPVTPAEEKADAVLSCINGCNGVLTCQNQCIYTGYNVPSTPPAGVPPPVVPAPLPSGATTVPSATAAAAATPTGTTTQGSSASKSKWHVASAAALTFSSLFFMA
ncbi:hypothetical protein BGZ74_005093 [Mortierella antarctica]|nr:hypothetical protein BGZ74_005093 [Mortierella antarctica]